MKILLKHGRSALLKMETPKKLKNTSFRPAQDVADWLAAVIEKSDAPHGLKSRLINDALRIGLEPALKSFLQKQREVSPEDLRKLLKQKR